MSERRVLKLNVVKKLGLAVVASAALMVPMLIGAMISPAMVPKSPPPTQAAATGVPLDRSQHPAAITPPRQNLPLVAQQRITPPVVAPTVSEGIAVILIIDRSASMEGKKLESARSAVSSVIENLRPMDTLGVLTFDNRFEWTVTPRHVEDAASIKELLVGITADRGTEIAPALTEAYTRVLSLSATRKHIVLLTDGISEEGNSVELARGANDNKVTISTIGLGPDVNRAYLQRIAEAARGAAYFIADPQNLQDILLRDVQDHTGLPPN